MGQICIDYPDAIGPRIANALARNGGYDALPLPKPTKAQFAKQQIIDYVRRVVQQDEAQVAAQTARDTAQAKADADIVIS